MSKVIAKVLMLVFGGSAVVVMMMLLSIYLGLGVALGHPELNPELALGAARPLGSIMLGLLVLAIITYPFAVREPGEKYWNILQKYFF